MPAVPVLGNDFFFTQCYCCVCRLPDVAVDVLKFLNATDFKLQESDLYKVGCCVNACTACIRSLE